MAKDSDEKFSVLFEVAGSGLQSLNQIENKIDSIAARAASIGNQSMGGLVEGFKDVVKEAATFQDIESSLEFSFGKQKWKGVYEDVKSDAAKLTFTLAEVADLAASLGKMKINPFGGENKADQEFMSRTGEKIRALEVLQDTADAAGKSTQDLTVAIRNAMSGQWVSLATRFDIPKEKIDAWKKEINKLGTPQEKYNLLVSKLAMDYGGAGKLKEANYNKVSAQIPDILQQIKGGAGAAGLKVIAAELKNFVDALGDLAKDKDTMKALSDAFTLMAKAAAAGLKVATGLIRGLQMALSMFPQAPTVLAIGAALTVLAGTIAATTAAIVGLGFAVTSIGLVPVLATVGASLVLIVGVLGTLTAGVMLAASAFEVWGEGSNGVAGSFERLKVILGAVQEALQNWSGETTYITEETKNRLDDIGVGDTFLEIVGALQRVKSFSEEVANGFMKEWKTVSAPIKQSLLALWDTVKIVATAFGSMFGGAKTDLQGVKTEGEGFGEAMAQALGFIAEGLTWAIGLVRDLLADFNSTMNTIADIYITIMSVWNVLQIVVDIVGGALYIAVMTVVAPFRMVYEAVLGISDIIGGIIDAFKTGDVSKFTDGLRSGAGHAEKMKDSIFDIGRAAVKTGEWIGKDIEDIGKAEAKADKMRNFGARMEANMADAAARNQADRFGSSRFQPGIGFGAMTPDEIQELALRSKMATIDNQPNMSVDRIGDVGYENYLNKKQALDALSRDSQAMTSTDPYSDLKTPQEVIEAMMREGVSGGMSPYLAPTPQTQYVEAPPGVSSENTSSYGQTSTQMRPVQVENNTTIKLELEGQPLKEFVIKSVNEDARRAGTSRGLQCRGSLLFEVSS